MNRKITPPIPEAIVQLQRQLDQFQPRRTKLPESLWQAAVELARQHGIYPVAHPLRLDYMGLKKRLGGVPIVRRKASKPAFVELITPLATPPEECVIEFESPGQQGADPVEGIGAARLGKPAARLARSRRMIQIAPQIRILVALEAIDGRKGIDAIAQLCREKLDADPFSGYLFIFRTRRGTAVRVLQYDGQGFWLATKRLSKGRFRW